MSICIGEVVAVNGLKVTVRANDASNHDTLFLNGKKYRGVSINELILIERGFRNIVCRIEGEQLDESKIEENNSQRVTKTKYLRKIIVKPIGYFENSSFYEGHKYLPMIKDKVFLTSNSQVNEVYGSKINTNQNAIKIGNTLKENISVTLPWNKLFTSHIGVFGNTGSGKSNTLTKLYTELFEKNANKIAQKSKFVVIDFNGEYTKEQLAKPQYKEVCNLDTRNNEGEKVSINSDYFWNTEVLSMLFKATENTQKPFLNRLVRGREKYNTNAESFLNYLKKTFEKVFTATEQKREVVSLFVEIFNFLEEYTLVDDLQSLSWNATNSYFYRKVSNTQTDYFNGGTDDDAYTKIFKDKIEDLNIVEYVFFDEFLLRIKLQLINDLHSGYAHFEHIQPLLKRAESSISSLEKVLNVDNRITESNNKFLNVISLRKCNQEVKKIIPLLLAKQFYEGHKKSVENYSKPPTTLHLIIDEAHNILSNQSIREQETWKDYRLELFEEIVKEGRKFGVFLTLSSQRPADISPTIMSQLHNYFIHKLVNDRDLALLDNTINTLDSISKGMIPHLSKGCCVVTGTAFEIPLVMQVDLLPRVKQPDSEDIDLLELWE